MPDTSKLIKLQRAYDKSYADTPQKYISVPEWWLRELMLKAEQTRQNIDETGDTLMSDMAKSAAHLNMATLRGFIDTTESIIKTGKE